MSGTRGADERKVGSLRELSPAIEPARDLWPQIEARIKRGAQPAAAELPRIARARALPPRWLAAAAVVASDVAVGLVDRQESAAGGPPRALSPRSAPRARALPDSPTAPSIVAYVSDPRYQRDRTALVKTLQARLAALPLPARAKVMAGSSWRPFNIQAGSGERARQGPGQCAAAGAAGQHYQDEMRVLRDIQPATLARGI